MTDNPTSEEKPSWWADDFDERERNEIRFAHIYRGEFQHGTDGHHRLLLISKLATTLDLLSERVRAADSNYRTCAQTNKALQERLDDVEETLAVTREQFASMSEENRRLWNAQAAAQASTTIPNGMYTEHLEHALNALIPNRSWSGKLRGYKSDRAYSLATDEVRRARNCSNAEARALVDGALAVLRRG
ncbi:MAG TPA: hypothetical protein VIG47_09660 [Gemmatimonadaceae bacterium]